MTTTPCGNAIKQMLGHLHAFEFRMGHRYDDNSAAQSAHDLFRVVNGLNYVCPDEHAETRGLREKVSQVLVKHNCQTHVDDDLSKCNLVPLWRASPDLQQTLIPCRPFLEQMHWRAAFAYPKLISGPNWSS